MIKYKYCHQYDDWYKDTHQKKTVEVWYEYTADEIKTMLRTIDAAVQICHIDAHYIFCEDDGELQIGWHSDRKPSFSCSYFKYAEEEHGEDEKTQYAKLEDALHHIDGREIFKYDYGQSLYWEEDIQPDWIEKETK